MIFVLIDMSPVVAWIKKVAIFAILILILRWQLVVVIADPPLTLSLNIKGSLAFFGLSDSKLNDFLNEV